jgi:hypothetical protein
MSRKTLYLTLTALAVAYAGIYYYQRFKRRKADESVTDLKKAEEIIENL